MQGMELAATSGKTSQFPGNDSHVGYTKRCHLLVYPRQALRGRPTTTMPPSPTSLVCQVLYLGTPQTRSFHTLQTSNSNHAPDLAYSGSLVLNHTPDWALRLAKRHRQPACNGGQHTNTPCATNLGRCSGFLLDHVWLGMSRLAIPRKQSVGLDTAPHHVAGSSQSSPGSDMSLRSPQPPICRHFSR